MRQSSPISAVSPMTMPIPWSMTRRLPYFRAGVYLDARDAAAVLRNDAGQQLVAVGVAPVGALVALGSLYPG